MKAKIYALYKGDTNICDGTIAQIARQLNILPKSVAYYRTPAYARKASEAKNPRPRRTLVLLND